MKSRGLPDHVPNTRAWWSVTSELAADDSPLLSYLTELYPNYHVIQRRYRSHRHERVVDPLGHYDSLIGTAFDHMIQCRFDPTAELALAEAGAEYAMEDGGFLCLQALESLRWMDLQSVATARLAQFSFAAALFTTVGRKRSVLRSPEFRRFFPPEKSNTVFASNELLRMAPDVVIANLLSLYDLALEELIPHFSSDDRENTAAPVFDGSSIIAADGDFVSARTLFEFKTTTADTLAMKFIYQLACYLLLDFSDQHRLESLTYYSTRFGHIATWPAVEFLSILAQRQVTLTDERLKFRHFLMTNRPHPFGKAQWWSGSEPESPRTAKRSAK